MKQKFKHVQKLSVFRSGGFGHRAIVRLMPQLYTSPVLLLPALWITMLLACAPRCMFICVLSANRQASHEASRERVSAVSLVR